MLERPSWLCAVAVLSSDLREVRLLLGTASMIGGAYFLTARHVVERPIEGDEILALVRERDDGAVELDVIRATQYLGDADLAVGWVTAWREDPPFSGCAYSIPGADAKSVGYPESLATLGAQPLSSFKLHSRTYRGHVTRLVEPEDGLALCSTSVEVDFQVGAGMSGAPLYVETARDHGLPPMLTLHGVVTGTTATVHRGAEESFGIAALLLAFAAGDYPVEGAGGLCLNQIMCTQLRPGWIPIPDPAGAPT